MVGPVGKKYEAIKDYLEWNGFELKEWVPIVNQMGGIWVSNIKEG